MTNEIKATEEQYQEIAEAIIDNYDRYGLFDDAYDDCIYEVDLEDRQILGKYNSYEEFVRLWKPSLIADEYNLGTEDEDGNWNFYLTKEQFEIAMSL